MNAHNTTPHYTTPGQTPPITYGQPPPPPVSESRIDKAYVTSIRGILKFACLVIDKRERLFIELINVYFFLVIQFYCIHLCGINTTM